MIDNSFFNKDEFGSDRFIGKIVRLDIGPSRWDSERQVLHMEVENLSRRMTFNFEKEISPSKRRPSGWTLVIEAFSNVGCDLNPSNLASLVGRTFWFVQKDVELGQRKNKDTGATEPMVIKNLLLPTKVATEQDLWEALKEQAAAEATANEPVATVSTSDTDDLEACVMAMATGISYDELKASFDAQFPDMAERVNRPLIARMVIDGKLRFHDSKYEATQGTAA
jgi:hypothetical protein